MRHVSTNTFSKQMVIQQFQLTQNMILGAGVKSTQPAWSQPTAWAHHFSVKSTHLRKVNPSGAKHNEHTTEHGTLQHAQFAQNIAHTESMSSFWLKTIVRVKCKTQWAHHKQGVISTCWICTKQCAHWVNTIILFKKSVHVKCKTHWAHHITWCHFKLKNKFAGRGWTDPCASPARPCASPARRPATHHHHLHLYHRQQQ